MCVCDSVQGKRKREIRFNGNVSDFMHMYDMLSFLLNKYTKTQKTFFSMLVQPKKSCFYITLEIEIDYVKLT